MKVLSNHLDHPPFPPMTWSDCDWWDGEIDLKQWEPAGLTVTPNDPEVSRSPSVEQESALAYHMNFGEQVEATVLASLLSHYQEMWPRYQEFLGPDAGRLMPLVNEAKDLRALIDLRQVHVHPWSREGTAYVGLQFGCTCDVEHGLGVMMHRNRIVDIGEAAVSFAWEPDEAGSG